MVQKHKTGIVDVFNESTKWGYIVSEGKRYAFHLSSLWIAMGYITSGKGEEGRRTFFKPFGHNIIYESLKGIRIPKKGDEVLFLTCYDAYSGTKPKKLNYKVYAFCYADEREQTEGITRPHAPNALK